MSNHIKHLTLHIFLLAVLLSSCTPRAVREAQEVVAHADSLREAHLYAQNEYDDSLSLAQAYETLKEIPLPFRGWLGLNSSYAHACYHYGRMLRAKDYHVEAMKVFIDATHSRTRDFHILGRIYSNMGSMCHLAGEYQLSYDMFAISADYFLQNGDTINYYYGLNDMALELAEQGKKDETLVLLENIEEKCTNTDVISLANLTKTVLYEEIRQHDSVIYYANLLSAAGKETATSAITKAQAFYHLQKYDSALYYAHLTLKLSSSLFDKDNAYYILIHCDSIFGGTDVYTLSSIRADNEKEIEIRHGKLSTAVQLLEQDIEYRSKYAERVMYVLLILAITLIVIILIAYKAHRKHKRFIQEKNASLYQLEQKNTLHLTRIQTMYAEIENRCNILVQSPNLKQELCWKEYGQMCRIADQLFYLFASKLQKEGLKEREIRLCLLVLLNLSHARIADMMFVEENSVGKLKERTAKRLSTSRKNIREKLLKITIGDES